MYKIIGPKPMKETAESIKARLRFLSFGPDAGSMWRWTYHDGSTLVTLCYNHTSTDGTSHHTTGNLVGWACLTYQEEPIPVVGVFVAPDYRGQGLGTRLVSPLAATLRERGERSCYAVASNWPRYPELLHRYGLKHEEWE